MGVILTTCNHLLCGSDHGVSSWLGPWGGLGIITCVLRIDKWYCLINTVVVDTVLVSLLGLAAHKNLSMVRCAFVYVFV